MARPADPHAHSALVAAARAEFVASGIQRARIEDITARCSLSKGAFYLHFESKEALFREQAEELAREFEALRAARAEGYAEIIAAHRRRGQLVRDPELLAQLAAQDAAQDRLLLELLWRWRDVIDVLLRGCQGTEFDGLVWQMLDQEVARVRVECEALRGAGLLRADVEGEVVGLMVVGTYVLVARKLSMATEQPDFEALVGSLQRVLALGTRPVAVAPRRPARARRALEPTTRKLKNRSTR
jgi:AcrR family transcriptional regulator